MAGLIKRDGVDFDEWRAGWLERCRALGHVLKEDPDFGGVNQFVTSLILEREEQMMTDLDVPRMPGEEQAATGAYLSLRAAPIKHEPGIYFGLPADEYHADPALGSSNIKQLRRNPSSYWWDSWMNPARPPDRDTPSRLVGRAMHTLIFDGEAAFDRAYCRGPDQDEDATPAEKSAITKAAKKKALAEGRAMVEAQAYDRVAIASAMIRQNPELATIFVGGMSEVSVFHEMKVDGEVVRCKARFDYLKPRGIGDLKSIANQHDMEFRSACRLAIRNYRYDVQAQYYLGARARLATLVDNVVGDHDPAWLKKVVAAKVFGWQWVFHQTEGAPVTWSYVLSPANPICEVAQNDIDRALLAFVENRRRYADGMWLLVEKPQELAIEELPYGYGRD